MKDKLIILILFIANFIANGQEQKLPSEYSTNQLFL